MSPLLFNLNAIKKEFCLIHHTFSFSCPQTCPSRSSDSPCLNPLPVSAQRIVLSSSSCWIGIFRPKMRDLRDGILQNSQNFIFDRLLVNFCSGPKNFRLIPTELAPILLHPPPLGSAAGSCWLEKKAWLAGSGWGPLRLKKTT